MPLLPLNLLQKFNSYRQALKRNNFVQALVVCPSNLRYQLPKQRWIANRLGLYRTILQQNSHLVALSKRAKIAKIVAILKHEVLTQPQADKLIGKILQSTYTRFHLEFIRDIGFKYPETIFEFVKRHHQQHDYYLGLYLALLITKSPTLPSSTLQVFKNLVGQLQDKIEQDFLISNAITPKPADKLELLNGCFTHFKLMNLTLKNPQDRFSIDNLQVKENHLPISGTSALNKPCVTVLVTCYNAEDTIAYCLQSLLQQTWQNLEIIVIDDASTDNTKMIVEGLGKKDNRITLLTLDYNVGTYVAKSMGAEQATGVYLTCQDADDFAHPQKIERQVQPLISDEKLAVTTSYWLRIDKNGQYYARHYYPFVRQNPASPMFRREQVKSDTGLWHLVRTGADSEFFERLKLVYGKQAILAIKEPLTLASHRENSLMTSAEFGAYDHQSALDRLDYWENWRLWHIECLASQYPLKMTSLRKQIEAKQDIFDIPPKIKINKENVLKNLNKF